MREHLQSMMEIAHDREQSVLQQKLAFQILLETIVTETREKLLLEIREQRRRDTEEELRKPPYI